MWQSRGLTCLFSFCATGEIAHGRRVQLSTACLSPRERSVRSARVESSSSGILVCGSRARALPTHGTTFWLRMRHRDDSSPPVSCTHLLTAWLVTAVKAVSSSRFWAGRTSPREFCLRGGSYLNRRTHAGFGAGRTNSEVCATRGWEPITRARHPL